MRSCRTKSVLSIEAPTTDGELLLLLMGDDLSSGRVTTTRFNCSKAKLRAQRVAVPLAQALANIVPDAGDSNVTERSRRLSFRTYSLSQQRELSELKQDREKTVVPQ